MKEWPNELPPMNWKKLTEKFSSAGIGPSVLKQYEITDDQFHNLMTSQNPKPYYDLCAKLYKAAMDRLTAQEREDCLIES